MMFPKPEKKEKAKPKPLPKATKKIKQKSKRLAKAERDRTPLTDGRCWVTGQIYGLDKHEIFGGCKRQLSMKWGMVIELNRKWHDLAKTDPFVRLFFQKWGQRQFEKLNPEVDFAKIFGMNYLAKPYRGTVNVELLQAIREERGFDPDIEAQMGEFGQSVCSEDGNTFEKSKDAHDWSEDCE